MYNRIFENLGNVQKKGSDTKHSSSSGSTTDDAPCATGRVRVARAALVQHFVNTRLVSRDVTFQKRLKFQLPSCVTFQS